MREASYGRLADGHPWDDLAVGKMFEIVTEHGVYRGDYLRSWLGGLLADYGVRTFADLPYTDPDRADPGRRCPVVMNVSDVTSGWLRQLPWDYRDCYRLDPGGQAVVNAVRCSMSIPFFFHRFLIMADVNGRQHGMVDGGLLSIFPIGLFDVPEGVTPRWPTFGIKLSTRLSDVQKAVLNHVGSMVSMSLAMLNTLTGCYDQMHLNDPSVVARTIFVDTAGIAATDFDLTPGQPDLLVRQWPARRGRIPRRRTGSACLGLGAAQGDLPHLHRGPPSNS